MFKISKQHQQATAVSPSSFLLLFIVPYPSGPETISLRTILNWSNLFDGGHNFVINWLQYRSYFIPNIKNSKLIEWLLDNREVLYLVSTCCNHFTTTSINSDQILVYFLLSHFFRSTLHILGSSLAIANQFQPSDFILVFIIVFIKGLLNEMLAIQSIRIPSQSKIYCVMVKIVHISCIRCDIIMSLQHLVRM